MRQRKQLQRPIKPGATPQDTARNIAAGLRKQSPRATHVLVGAALVYGEWLGVITMTGWPGHAPDMSTQIEFGTFATDPPEWMTGHFDTVLAIRKASDVTLKEGRELRRLLIAELRKLRFNVEAFDSDLALAKAMVARFPSQESMRMLNVLQAEMACTGARA